MSPDAAAAATEKPAPLARFPPAVANTIDWLQDRFRHFYRDNPPSPPDRLTRREYGFILWPRRPGPPPFVRHKSYRDAAGLHGELARTGPHSAYYSTAYYRRPGAAKMVEKEWLGAELIFDLDADHLQEAEAAKAAGSELSVESQLALVKDQFIRLLDEFLLGDLGLDERDLFITFSGGRGYHCHVTDPRLLGMDAKGRREIVDYVTGKVPTKKGTNDPDMSAFLHKVAVDVQGRGKYAKAREAYQLAPADAAGWPGRLTRGVVAAIEENVIGQPEEEAARWLRTEAKMTPKATQNFLDKIRRKDRVLAQQRETFAYADEYLGIADLVRAGRLSTKSDPIYKVAEKVLGNYALPSQRGETDEPVTADVKRLIRLPGSLHGKTGLRVVTLQRDDLAGFDPLRDAVALSMDPARFTPRFDATLALGGESVTVAAGEATEVPEAHAVWWCARQAGTIGGPA